MGVLGALLDRSSPWAWHLRLNSSPGRQWTGEDSLHQEAIRAADLGPPGS